MSTAGILFSALMVAAAAMAAPIRRWWRKGCDACRLEDIGGGPPMSNVMHSCFPWRSPYRSRDGQVYEFGKALRHRASGKRRTDASSEEEARRQALGSRKVD